MSDTDVTIADVRVEHRRDALGIGASQPRLSWTVVTAVKGRQQSAYEIEAWGSDDQRRDQTGRIASDQSVLAP